MNDCTWTTSQTLTSITRVLCIGTQLISVWSRSKSPRLHCRANARIRQQFTGRNFSSLHLLTVISSSGRNKSQGSNSSNITARISPLWLASLLARMGSCSQVFLKTGPRKCSMSSISVWPFNLARLVDFSLFLLSSDMINMIKLGHTPHACCWVHRRGQAQSLLAV
jgi:hypothetical protein